VSVKKLLAKPHESAVQATGALEDVHLPTADQGDGVRLDERDLTIDQMLAGSTPRPDELVIVVAMRATRPTVGVRSETRIREQHHLQREARLGQPINGDLAARHQARRL